jgi:hypothetical protein
LVEPADSQGGKCDLRVEIERAFVDKLRYNSRKKFEVEFSSERMVE